MRLTDVKRRANPVGSRLPLYRYALDWEALYARFPPPDVFVDTVHKPGHGWTVVKKRRRQQEREPCRNAA